MSKAKLINDIEDTIPEDNPEDAVFSIELPQGKSFIAPCLGAVGSKPFLDDISAQLNENHHASVEGRDARILPIVCRLCNEYHVENQFNPIATYKGQDFEEFAYQHIAPRPANPSPPHAHLVALAADAVTRSKNPDE